MDTYNTIAHPVSGEYKEKGSKFIALAFEVNSTAEIKIQLEDVKKEHFKARHHCYAWRLGLGKDDYRANDDGEPSSTAGRPILGQIDSFGLTNVFIVVVRYYGGTKLGTSGLKNAYKAAAQDALSQASIVERIIKSQCCLLVDYPLLSEVMQYLKEMDLSILETAYDAETVKFSLAVRNDLIPAIEEAVKENWKTAKLEWIS